MHQLLSKYLRDRETRNPRNGPCHCSLLLILKHTHSHCLCGTSTPMLPELLLGSQRGSLYSLLEAESPLLRPLLPPFSLLHTNHLLFFVSSLKGSDFWCHQPSETAPFPSLHLSLFQDFFFFFFSFFFGADLLLKQFSILWRAEHFVWGWGERGTGDPKEHG